MATAPIDPSPPAKRARIADGPELQEADAMDAECAAGQMPPPPAPPSPPCGMTAGPSAAAGDPRPLDLGTPPKPTREHEADLRRGGRCQRQGVLVVLTHQRIVTQISVNCLGGLGYSAEQLLGRSIDVALDELSVAALRNALERSAGEYGLGDYGILDIEAGIRTPATGLRWDASVHRPFPFSESAAARGLAVLELEPRVAAAPESSGPQGGRCSVLSWGRPADPAAAAAFERRIPHITASAVRPVIDRLNAHFSETAVCQAVAAALASLTDFERVLVYRFCGEGHGTVVGEFLAPGAAEGLQAFMGLHFPSSDIPRNARQLFYENRVRLIPDATDEGVEVVPSVNPVSHTPLDMTRCTLRAATECCNQYHRVIESYAQLIFCVVVERKLWGLITCHCRHPRFVPAASRNALTPLVQVFGKCLEMIYLDRKREAEMRVKRLSLEMFSRLASDPDGIAADLFLPPAARPHPEVTLSLPAPAGPGGLGGPAGPAGLPRRGSSSTSSKIDSMERHSNTLLDIVDCCGAAVVQGGLITAAGLVPSNAEILALVDVMKSLPAASHESSEEQTDILTSLALRCVSEVPKRTATLWFAESAVSEMATCAAGMALGWFGGFAAAAVERGHVLWFREAKSRAVHWAGDVGPYTVREGVMEARASLEIWRQLVADRCPAWTETDVSAVAAFAAAARNAFVLIEGLSARRAYDRLKGIQALTAQEEYEQLLASLPVPIVILDSAGTVRQWSAKMADILGRSGEEAVGQACLAAFNLDADSEAWRTFSDVIRKANLHGFTTTGVELVVPSRTRARRLVLLVSVAPRRFLPPHGTPAGAQAAGPSLGYGAIVLCQEMTRERELVQAARALEARALEASTAKSLFLATLSHEIRTPLNGCLGMLQLTRELPGLPAEGGEYLEKAVQSCEILQTMISSVLDWTLIEAGRLALRTVEFDLRAMVAAAVAMVAPKAAEKGLAIEHSFADGFPSYAAGDCDRLRQVLLNGLTNAVKYSERGVIAVRCTVLDDDVKSLTTVDYVGFRLRISVSDQGRGIAAESIPKLFRIFSRVVDDDRPDPGGTGLGLAISRRLIELLGGTVEVESAVGVGSTFHFEFPITVLRRPPLHATVQRAEGAIRNAALPLAPLPSRPSCGSPTAAAAPGGATASSSEAAGRGRPGRRSSCPGEIPLHLHPDAASPRGRPATSPRPAAAGSGAGAPAADARPAAASPPAASGAPPPTTAAAATPAKTAGGSLNAADAPGASAPQVLLVEDNKLNAQVAAKLLKACGCAVFHAWDGVEAVDMLTTPDAPSTYDLVFMDAMMPRKDGLQATREVRAHEAALGLKPMPIVALTANVAAECRDEALAAGQDDYLTKPILKKDLAAAVAKYGLPRAEARLRAPRRS